MTWNIRFGVARLDFALDACGDRVIISKNEVITGLEGIAKKIYDLNVDVIFGGLGIELLPDISDTIDKTFVTFKELNNLV